MEEKFYLINVINIEDVGRLQNKYKYMQLLTSLGMCIQCSFLTYALCFYLHCSSLTYTKLQNLVSGYLNNIWYVSKLFIHSQNHFESKHYQSKVITIFLMSLFFFFIGVTNYPPSKIGLLIQLIKNYFPTKN